MDRRLEAPAGVAGSTTTRVRYPETDRMGVAHHTHVFVWFELGRTELMRDRGCAYGELEDLEGIHFPVVRAEAAYHGPARYDEIVTIDTRLTALSAARVRFEYAARRAGDGTILARGMTEHACVNRDGRPRRMPAWLRRRLGGTPERGS